MNHRWYAVNVNTHYNLRRSMFYWLHWNAYFVKVIEHSKVISNVPPPPLTVYFLSSLSLIEFIVSAFNSKYVLINRLEYSDNKLYISFEVFLLLLKEATNPMTSDNSIHLSTRFFHSLICFDANLPHSNQRTLNKNTHVTAFLPPFYSLF